MLGLCLYCFLKILVEKNEYVSKLNIDVDHFMLTNIILCFWSYLICK